MSGSKCVRVLVAAATAMVCMLAAPAVGSAAGLVDDVVGGVDETVDGLLGGGDAGTGGAGGGDVGTGGAGGGGPAPASAAEPEPETAAGAPPDYTPPAHGTTPHGTGTGVIVDVTPSDQEPLPYESGGGSEEVVVGSSHGEADADGNYHGHVTILSLLGNELLEGADTDEGESSRGPFGDLNALLSDLCTSTGDQLCLSVLDVNSNTTDSGSSNSFDLATARVGTTGDPVVEVGAVQTTGSVSDDGTCQTATGTSQVADANVLGITADVINASSESRACNDGSSSQTNGGNVLTLGGSGVPLPQAGCENGTPNTVFSVPVVNLVVEAVCNADDSSTSGGLQVAGPYGVREGVAVFALPVLGNPLKAVTATGESHARAPGDDDQDDDGIPDTEDACPTQPGPASNNGCPLDEGGGGGDGGGADGDGPGGLADEGPGDRDGDGILNDEDACPSVPGPASNDGCPLAGPGGPGEGPTGEGADALPFTGADIGFLGAIGLAVFASGLALMALADRRRRASDLPR